MITVKKSKLKKSAMIICLYFLIGVSSYLLFTHYLQYKKILTPLNITQCEYKVSLSDGTLIFNNRIIDNTDSVNKDDKYTKVVNKQNYLNSYLKFDPRPSKLLEGFSEKTENSQTFYYDLNGKILNNNYVFTYTNADSSESFNIVTSKDKLPADSPFNKLKDIKSSEMLNTKMYLCYYRDSNKIYHYYAQFKYKNTGYLISGTNLSQEQFIEILFSLIS